jgi:hypothetical protein
MLFRSDADVLGLLDAAARRREGLGAVGGLEGPEDPWWDPALDGKIYTYPDGSQCLRAHAFDTCIPLQPCPAGTVHRDDPGYNPVSCSAPPGGALVCSPGWVPSAKCGHEHCIEVTCRVDQVRDDCGNCVQPVQRYVIDGLALDRDNVTGIFYIPFGTSLPLPVYLSQYIGRVRGYDLEGVQDPETGVFNYIPSWNAAYQSGELDGIIDRLRGHHPVVSSQQGACLRPGSWPLASAAALQAGSPCVNFAEHGKVPGAQLRAYYDWTVAEAVSKGAAGADRIAQGTQAFLTFYNEGQEPQIGPQTTYNGRTGRWHWNVWSVFLGPATEGKVVIQQTPFFDTDVDWAAIFFDPLLIAKAIAKLPDFLCNPVTAAAATYFGTGTKTAYDVACALITGGSCPSGYVRNATGGCSPYDSSSSSSTPWLIAGGAALLLGGLSWAALRKRD